MESDDLFLMAIRGCNDEKEILDKFFGFLQRHTDLFHLIIEPADYDVSFAGELNQINSRGFPPGHVNKLVDKILKKYSLKYLSLHQPYLINNAKLMNKYTNHTLTDDNIISSKKSDKTISNEIPQSINRDKVPNNDNYTYNCDHNGGVTDKYCWSQTINDVTIEINSNEIVEKKDVLVNITPYRLHLKTPAVVIDGEWPRKIICNDNFNWFIQDKHKIIVSVDKVEECWWDCLLKGDPKIDTQKIESVKKLSELDEKSQHFIRNALEQHYNHAAKPFGNI